MKKQTLTIYTDSCDKQPVYEAIQNALGIDAKQIKKVKYIECNQLDWEEFEITVKVKFTK